MDGVVVTDAEPLLDKVISPTANFMSIFMSTSICDSAFPSESKEHCGCWVGISENDSHFMTFKVLTNDTLKVINQSNICSAHDPTAKNLCLDLLNENFPKIVKALRQQSGHRI